MFNASVFLALSFLELLVNQMLIMAQLEERDEALVDHIVAIDHGTNELHRVVPHIVELLVLASLTLVSRLTHYLLAVFVNERDLTRL